MYWSLRRSEIIGTIRWIVFFVESLQELTEEKDPFLKQKSKDLIHVFFFLVTFQEKKESSVSAIYGLLIRFGDNNSRSRFNDRLSRLREGGAGLVVDISRGLLVKSSSHVRGDPFLKVLRSTLVPALKKTKQFFKATSRPSTRSPEQFFNGTYI